MSQEDQLAGLMCSVCREYYEDGRNRVPVSLPCGHTFCRSCLQQVEWHQQTNDAFCCPTCRTPHPELCIYKLSPNFALLSLLDSYKIVGGELPKRCGVHKREDHAYWCQTCAELVCGLCISQSHRSDRHIIVSAALARDEKRDRMEETMTEMKERLNTRFKNHLTDGVAKLFHLTTRTTRLITLSEDLSCTRNTISAPAMGIDMMIASEEKLQELQRCLEDIESEPVQPPPPLPLQSSGPTSNTTTTETPEESSSSMHDSPTSSQSTTDVVTFLADSTDPSTTTKTLGDLAPELISNRKIRETVCQVRYRHERLGNLVGEGRDKLALHAFSGQILSGHFTIDWPVFAPHVPLSQCRVFLDLVTNCDKERLGRVTIRVWEHLRRARHFLGLTLGLWGSSYKRSTFLRVHSTEYCKFVISGGHYDESTGITSTGGLLDNLEWAGDFTGYDSVGQVVAFGGGRTHLDAVFGICIEENVPGGRSRCPFGVVEEGLDVMKMAASFMSASTQVQIIDCGIIFSLAPMNSSSPEGCRRDNEGASGLDIQQS